jgi:hypothetical protein
MERNRLDKMSVRNLWADEYEAQLGSHDDVRRPVYLTLPGASGRDLDILVSRNLVQLTENGAIAPEDASRIVAVESAPAAVIALLEKYAGLKVIQERLEAALRSTGPTRWPDTRNEAHFRASLVNLDFDKPFTAERDQGVLRFPTAQMVSKIAQLHAKAPRVEWTLCLTVNGLLPWDDATAEDMRRFLSENCDRDPRFRDGATSLVGDELLAGFCAGERSVASLRPDQCQRLLMVLVPKHIALLTHGQGWRLEARRNLRYGGDAGAAPMVTWIIDFRWDERATTQPDAVYRDSISGLFGGVGSIDPDGTLSH